VDADHIAYYLSGWYPQRADSTSPDFPILGTGEYDWKGYDPSIHTLNVLPFEQHPNAIDPDYLVSWNNKQAPGWAAADDNYFYGSVFRSRMIEQRVKDAIAGGRTMRIEQLVSAMDEPATTDVRMFALWPTLKRVLGTPDDPQLRDAIAKLDAWYADGGHRRDMKKSGVDEHQDAITIMDAWWPKLLDAEFHPALGDDAFAKLHGMIGFGAPNPGTPATDYPSFSVGWYGYVSKDLRDLLTPPSSRPAAARCHTVTRRVRRHGRVVRRHGRVVRRRVRVCPGRRPSHRRRTRPHRAHSSARRAHRRHGRHRRARRPVRRPQAPIGIPGAYSRVYCGGGSLEACRTALLSALRDALGMTPAQIYGQGGPCASDPQASCYDRDRSTVASGVSTPKSYPFQNRPTFQQVVELTQRLAR
jgi:hypothetical protein